MLSTDTIVPRDCHRCAYAASLGVEVERLRDREAEWGRAAGEHRAEAKRLREALEEIHALYGGKRAGLIAWAALNDGSVD